MVILILILQKHGILRDKCSVFRLNTYNFLFSFFRGSESTLLGIVGFGEMEWNGKLWIRGQQDAPSLHYKWSLCLLRISRKLSLIIFPLVVSCSRVPFSVRTFHKAIVYRHDKVSCRTIVSLVMI